MPKTISTHKGRWNKFRAEVIELDGGICVRCGRSPNDGVILQVHHKEYINGKLPWDYPYKLCETLCKGCHAAEHGKIPPKIGWTYLGEDDLGDLSGACEYCGTEIRYSFLICHEHWEPMEVGTVCCDNLTGTQLATNHTESMQRFERRRFRFVSSSRWKEQQGILTITQKDITIELRSSSGEFRIYMNGHKGKKVFASVESAKAAIFEVIENGKAERFLLQRARKPRD